MPVIPLEALAASLKGEARVLGLDVGTKTIGLALSDARRMVASPMETIRRTRLAADLARIGELVAKHGVGGFVVGLPVALDGREGPRCQAVRQFAKDLLGACDLPLAFWDERLSSAAVERVLIDEADMSRARRREVVDKMAAAYILQGALDRIARANPRAG
ncbi:MAG: Holliday junction resolvase RuvX [Alphaproteobacteria bacterium]|nr:Holliday junction resolvase RuvX [Alphaproteobacteria bacterium]MBM3951028.1 Holliday junction resolvase RuvX [Rhodospirillales bacterium]